MSPRAACQLEAIGFEKVYDYTLGIADWKGAGLPFDGGGPNIQTVADAMRPDIPTCHRDETVGATRERAAETGWQDCFVVECGSLVVGRLTSQELAADPNLRAGDVMQIGPTTVRPDGSLARLVERMDRRPTPLVAVATPQGELLGVVLRNEARRLTDGEAPEMIWTDCDGCPGQWRPAESRP